MNRKAFFRSLILGGIIVPRVPKLILTGGWLPNSVSFTVSGLDKGEFVGHFSGPEIIGIPGSGFSPIDIENDDIDADYFSEWAHEDEQSHPICPFTELYEQVKVITRNTKPGDIIRLN